MRAVGSAGLRTAEAPPARAASEALALTAAAKPTPDGQAFIIEGSSFAGIGADPMERVRRLEKLRRILGTPFQVVLLKDGATIAEITVEAGLADQQYGEEASALKRAADLGQCKPVACFLTTAAVNAVGLQDDCWELRNLRRFRDEVLAKTPEGQDLISRYYEFAPSLVHRVSERADARLQWVRLWLTGVLPSALAARLRLRRVALHFYKRMVWRLTRLVG